MYADRMSVYMCVCVCLRDGAIKLSQFHECSHFEAFHYFWKTKTKICFFFFCDLFSNSRYRTKNTNERRTIEIKIMENSHRMNFQIDIRRQMLSSKMTKIRRTLSLPKMFHFQFGILFNSIVFLRSICINSIYYHSKSWIFHWSLNWFILYFWILNWNAIYV